MQPSDLSPLPSLVILPLFFFLLTGCLWTFLYSFPHMEQGRWAGPAELMGPCLMSLGLPFLVGFVWLKRYEPHILARAAEPRWKRGVQLWESLYYCARHDGVFIPGETGLIAVEKMHQFLQSY